jgi:hypothetical protein
MFYNYEVTNTIEIPNWWNYSRKYKQMSKNQKIWKEEEQVHPK